MLRGWKFGHFRVIGAYLQSPTGSADMDIFVQMRLPPVMPLLVIWRV
jgi:hypothetical protein